MIGSATGTEAAMGWPNIVSSEAIYEVPIPHNNVQIFHY
jgi:hypothetical protein